MKGTFHLKTGAAGSSMIVVCLHDHLVSQNRPPPKLPLL